MANIENTTLSAIDDIIATVRRRDDFNFSQLLDSFIGNYRFREGSRRFLDGQHDTETFVWEALSSIGQDVGYVLTESVRNYIDKVSNVETCGMKSLYSMIRSLGFDYSFFSQLNFLPVEIQQLMDIFSMDYKYILKNGYLKDELLRDMEACEVITEISSQTLDCYTGHPFQIGLTSENKFVQGAVCRYALSNTAAASAYLSDYAFGAAGDAVADAVYAHGNISALQFDDETVFLRSGKLFGIVKYNPVPTVQTDAYNASTTFALSSLDKNASALSDNLSDAAVDDTLTALDAEVVLFPVQKYILGNRIVDEDAMDDYLVRIYQNLIMSFLEMHYNVDSQSVHKSEKIIDDIDETDGYFDTGYLNSSLTGTAQVIERIKKANQLLDFNQEGIVDNIDNCLDSLDNYSGAKLEILKLEIQRRVMPKYNDTVIDSKLSRYSYYRKAKVLEYARFIDERIYETLKNNGTKTYEIDRNYVYTESGYEDRPRVLRQGENGVEIDDTMVELVAKYLKDITKYVRKLRHTISIQTRKNYMKGTANLVRFVINEFLMDYARNNQSLFSFRTDEGDEDSMFNKLMNHSIDDVEVQEYFDGTEYFNISSETTKYAKNGDIVNERYFDQFFTRDENGVYINTTGPKDLDYDDIMKFYTDTLGVVFNTRLSTEGSQRQELLQFLDTIYGIGANGTYYSKEYDKVQTRLQNTQITEENIVRLSILQNSLSALLSNISEYLTDSYEMTSGVLSTQLNEITTGVIGAYSMQQLSGVNVTRDAMMPQVERISTDVATLSDDLFTFISGEYNFYFTKSEYRYCYEDNNDGTRGPYRHDWFVDNPDYDAEYLQEQIENLKNYSLLSSNMRNWEILDTVDVLLTGYGSEMLGYDQLYTRLYNTIINRITARGYTILSAENLETEMDSIDQFIESKLTQRQNILENSLEAMKTQANQLQSKLDSMKQTFQGIAEQLPDYSNGYYKYVGNGNGQYKVVSKTTEEAVFDPFSGSYIAEGSGGKKSILTKMSGVSGINPSDTFSKQIQTAISIAEIQPYTGDSGNQMQYSVLQSLKSIQGDIPQLRRTWDSLSAQVLSLFNLDIGEKVAQVNSEITTDNIQKLVEFLNSGITETEFQQDRIMKEYNILKADMLAYRVDYDKTKGIFDSFWQSSSQQQFLTEYGTGKDFTRTNLLDLSTYTIGKDEAVRSKVLAQIDDFSDQYDAILSDFQKTFEETQIYQGGDEYLTYTYTGENYIEMRLLDIQAQLDYDVLVRTHEGQQKISLKTEELDQIKENLYLYMFNDTYMSATYTTDWNISSIDPISAVVQTAIDQINYENFEEYGLAKDMFERYGGLSSSVSPWYNYKNLTHPSFQSHPFMMNFTRKNPDRSTDLSRTYTKLFSDEAITENVAGTIDNYIGAFGNTINAWKTNSIDFSGYVTDYEVSKHVSDNDIYNEIVDYEGAFYPPAVADSMPYIRYKENGGVISTLYHEVANRIDNNMISCALVSTLNDDTAYAYETLLLSTTNVVKQFRDVTKSATNVTAVVRNYIKEVCLCSDYTNFNGCVDVEEYSGWVKDNLLRSFYEKYYSHLGLTENEAVHIATQLSVWHDEILQTVGFQGQRSVNDSQLREVRDIYKYAKDSNKNHYILYKKYANGPLSTDYETKRNTRGELWIRLKDHPFAFPANKKDPYTQTYDFCNIAISSTSYDGTYINPYIFNGTNTDSLSGKCFYDFDMSNGGNMIVFVQDPLGKTDVSSYVSADVSMSYISPLVDDAEDRRLLAFTTRFIADDVEKFHATNIMLDSNGSKYLSAGYRLVGTSVGQTNQIRILYLTGLKSDQTIAGGTLRLFTVDTATDAFNPNTYDEYININPDTSRLSNNLITFSGYEVDGYPYMDVVTVEKPETYRAFSQRYFRPEYGLDSSDFSWQNVDLNSNPDGYDIDDPNQTEMNSHTMFREGNIVVKRYKINGYDMVRQDFGNVDKQEWFVPNADMSYIPLYPGLSGAAAIPEFAKYDPKTNYQNIELLGDSRNLDKELTSLNIQPNMYVEEGDFKLYIRGVKDAFLEKNHIVGRIFEDGMTENYNDKSLKIFHYPGAVKTPSSTQLSFNINLSATYGYTRDDLRTLNVAIFYRKSKGVNPYFVGPLDYLGHVPTNYVNTDDSSVRNEVVLGDGIAGAGQVYLAGGSYSFTDQFTFSGPNGIPNVKNIKFSYDRNTAQLRTEFEFNNSGEFAFIPENDLTFIFYSTKILNQFNYYHYMDAYGLVRSTELPEYKMALNNICADTWTLIYDDSNFPKTEDDKTEAYSKWRLLNDIKSYYTLKEGSTEASDMVYLEYVNLSDYQYLSDVYVLGGNLSGLSHKYDEEIDPTTLKSGVYLPHVGLQFPQTAGEIFEKEYVTQNFNIAESILKKIFDEDNLYILNLENSRSVISAIGDAYIPYIVGDIQEVRVFEDYYHSAADINGGLYGDQSFLNSQRFEPNLEGYSEIDKENHIGFGSFIHNVAEGVPPTFTCDNMTSVDYSGNFTYTPTMASRAFSTAQRPQRPQTIRLSALTAGSSSTTVQTEYACIKDFGSLNTDFSKFMNIYINYKKEPDKSITLYFNYNNYLNSPFDMIDEDGHIRPYVIEGSYLKLAAGESGFLNIFLQLKNFIGNNLVGLTHGRILSYHIINLSDDKPKFMIRKVYQPTELDGDKVFGMRDGNDIAITAPHMTLDYADYVDLLGNPKEGNPEVLFPISYTSTSRIREPFSFDVYYPYEMLSCTNRSELVDEEAETPGYMRLTYQPQDGDTKTLKFRFLTTSQNLIQYVGMRYPIEIDEVETEDENANITFNSGSIRVVYHGDIHLQTEEPEDIEYVETQDEDADISTVIILGAYDKV